MLPVISALLAFVAGLFRSRAALCLEHLALRHQLAVYQQTVAHPLSSAILEIDLNGIQFSCKLRDCKELA